jgi:hypothetical protein
MGAGQIIQTHAFQPQIGAASGQVRVARQCAWVRGHGRGAHGRTAGAGDAVEDAAGAGAGVAVMPAGRYRSPFWPQAESANAPAIVRALTRIDRNKADIEEL